MSGDPIADFLSENGIDPQLAVCAFAAAVVTLGLILLVAWLVTPESGK